MNKRTAVPREVNLTDEDWQKRNLKRLQVVHGTKSTPEYQRMSGLRERGELGTAEPSTPDANDRQISKRRWESLVLDWRTSLRQHHDFDGLTFTTPNVEAQLRHEFAMADRMAELRLELARSFRSI